MRMIEGTYGETEDRVVYRPEIPEEFRVDVGLRQVNALRPLFVFPIVEEISRKPSTRDILRR